MSIRRYAAIVIALTVSACASSSGSPSTQGANRDANESVRGTSRLIVRAQLAQLAGRSAFEAVEQFNQRWLRSARGTSVRGVASYPRVVVDGMNRGDVGIHRQIRSEDVESMRFISASDATTKYGTGFTGGAIEVTTRGR
jgi:hypothetical protein